GPTYFILRRFARRRWRLVTSDPNRRLSIFLRAARIEWELRTKGATMTVAEPGSGELPSQLVQLRTRSRRLSDLVMETNSPKQLVLFWEELDQIRAELDVLPPDSIRFSLRTQEPTDLQLEIDSALSDLPWDLLTGPPDLPLGISCAVSRVVAVTQRVTP